MAAGHWAVSRGRARLLVGAVAVLMAGNALITLLVMTNRVNPLGIDAPPAPAVR